MMQISESLDFSDKNSTPFNEMMAYESLWKKYSTVKAISDLFKKYPTAKPSDLAQANDIDEMSKYILNELGKKNILDYGIIMKGDANYPVGLEDALNPIPAFYYQGDISLLKQPKRVAIVGSRKPTADGIKRAERVARQLSELGYIIVSGLASGIDAEAHTTAIKQEGLTIAVIGTPITQNYPPENKDLQAKIAKDYLLISQVPIWKYSNQDYRINRGFFPERNKTMSALSDATIIIEASETSGTLIQARAALSQGRKLFILESCFSNPNITWPQKYLQKGAIKVSSINDITNVIGG